MTRKIFIGFIGVGPRWDDKTRAYSSALYSIGADGEKKESQFVSSVIMDHLGIKNALLFGTAKSMWETVYQHFCKTQGTFDETFFDELGGHCRNANNGSDIKSELLERAIKELSPNIKIGVMRYGLNDDELIENFLIFKSLLDENLHEGDEIYLDITHSFRSMPLFATTALMYIRDALGRNIKISGIYYGMLDIISELKYAPIIDLTKLVELQEWIKAAYTFTNFGRGELIEQLLTESHPKLAQNIQHFSDSLAINYLHEINNNIDVFTELADKTKYSDELAKMIVPGVFERFGKQLGINEQSAAVQQFAIAEWHYKNLNYGSAYIVLAEAIVTYVCEYCQIPQNGTNRKLVGKRNEGVILKSSDKIVREEAKQLIRNGNVGNPQFPYDSFLKINQIRNHIAHSIDDEIEGTMEGHIEHLARFFDEFRPLFS